MHATSKIGMWILGACAALALAHPPAKAQDEPILSGVETIKSAIRQAAAQAGLEGVQKLGPWRIRYTGILSAGKAVDLHMLPRGAFLTLGTAHPRDFQVELVNANLLFTDNGNLRELGVEISVVDLSAGQGESGCTLHVIFTSTGTRQPINLGAIAAKNPEAVKLEVIPATAAEFVGFQGEKAIFRRKSGDRTPVRVELKLKDGDLEIPFSTPLAACNTIAGGAEPVPPPTTIVVPPTAPPSTPPSTGSAPPAQTGGDPWVRTTRKLELQLRGSSGPSDFLRGRDYACKRAKEDLFELMITESDCWIEARKQYEVSGSSYAAFINSATVVDGSRRASCSCQEAPARGNCWSCTARGSIRCEIELIERRKP